MRVRNREQALYLEGAARVLKVIKGNPGYDNLLEKKFPATFPQLFQPGADAAGARRAALAYAKNRIETWKPTAYDIRGLDFVYYGKTRNNLREFAFFDRLRFKYGLSDTQDANLAVDKITRFAVKLGAKEKEQALAWLFALWSDPSNITPSCVYQAVQYTLAFITFRATFHLCRNDLPAVAVVANDHSPTHVAFITLARARGLQTVYIQHAEVTELFPPLAFSIAILRNEKSAEIYRNLGVNNTSIYVIARECTTFSAATFSAPVVPPVSVVLYLTAHIDEGGLRQTLAALQKNIEIGRICIKKHPGYTGSSLERIASVYGVDIMGHFPNFAHIAISGNSSVAIELLHRGIRVFQAFNLDPVPRDYYGFAKEGLTKELALDDMSSPFWNTFQINTEWLKVLSQYDPTVFGNSTKEAQEMVQRLMPRNKTRLGHLKHRCSSALAKAGRILGIIPERKRAISNKNDIIRKRLKTFVLALEHSADAGATVDQAIVRSLLPIEDVIKAIEALLQDRHPAGAAAIRAYREREPEAPFQYWRRLMQLTWTMHRPDPGEIKRLCQQFEHVHTYSSADMVSRNKALLLSAVLLNNDFDALRDHPYLFPTDYLVTLSANKKISVLNLLKKYQAAWQGGEAVEHLSQLRKRLSAESDPLQRLKLCAAGVPDFSLENFKDETVHRALEKSFLKLASPALQAELNSLVLPIYDALRPAMRFIDIRFSDAKREALLDDIQTALARRKPYGLVRLSEYEAYIFHKTGKYFGEKDAKWCERHWWGEELPRDVRENVLSYLHDSYFGADVVGIPSVMAFIRNYYSSTRSLLGTIQNRGLIEVLTAIGRATPPDALFTEDKINRHIFADPEFIRSLASKAERVVVVSSIRREHLRDSFPSGIRIDFLEVPTHFRTTNRAECVDGPKTLPYVFKAVAEDVRRLADNGVLVLVAAGVIGKGFIRDARLQGAVALDIGQDLEAWVAMSGRDQRPLDEHSLSMSPLVSQPAGDRVTAG